MLIINSIMLVPKPVSKISGEANTIMKLRLVVCLQSLILFFHDCKAAGHWLGPQTGGICFYRSVFISHYFIWCLT